MISTLLTLIRQATLKVLKWIVQMFCRLWFTLSNRPWRWYVGIFLRVNRSLLLLVLLLATILLSVILGMELQKPFDNFDKAVTNNLHLVRPTIERCVSLGGSMSWDLSVPDGIIGACITPEQQKLIDQGKDPDGDDEGDPGMPPPIGDTPVRPEPPHEESI